MPDILKPQSLIETGDKVRIPDVEELLFPSEQAEEGETDGEYAETESGEEDGEIEESEPKPDDIPEPEPEPEPLVLTKEDLAEYFGEELEELYQSEAQRGYSDGIQQKKGELKECIARVDQQLAQMQALQSQFMTRFADELKDLAINIAEKLIFTRIEENDLTLHKLVMQTISGVKNTNWLDVEVSEELVGLVEALKRELEKPEYHGRASVTATASPLDTVRVGSEDGTVVASVSTQAQNLRDIFSKT